MKKFFQRFVQPHGITQLLFLRNRLFFFRCFLRLFRDLLCFFRLLFCIRAFFLRRFLCFVYVCLVLIPGFFSRICQQIRHLFCLGRRFFKSVIIFFLLGRCQRFVLHFKFHRLIYILPFAEPENKVITFFQTFSSHAGFLIEFCQFICPLFDILRFLKLFQSLDLLLNRRALLPQNLIAQDILIRIFRRDLHKIIVIIYRFINIARLQRKRTEAADNFSAALGTVISNIKYVIAFLIFLVLFIYVTDLDQHGSISYSAPVNCIRYIRSFSICAVFHKLKHLFCF